METEFYKEKTDKIIPILKDFELPPWDELPKIYLYMDQIIELVSEYFKPFSEFSPGEKPLTSPMINNYIKLKVMPAPEKKRYSRVHLAYLIMITSMKQCMNIASIKRVIPVCEDENEVREIYEKFSAILKKACNSLGMCINEFFTSDASDPTDSLTGIIVFSNFMKIFISAMTAETQDETDTGDKKKDKADKKEKAEKKEKKSKQNKDEETSGE